MRSKALAAFNAVSAALPNLGAVTANTNGKRINHLLFIPLLLCAALCTFAGSTRADEGLTWPVKVDLLWPDADQNAPWHDVGDVILHNDRDKNLTVEIIPNDGLLIRTVGIHVVDDPEDFMAILDKKGQKPKIPKLDFRTDYRDTEDGPQAYHQEVIALDGLANEHFCWGVNPESCPPPYVIVHTQLQLPDGTILDGAYARNEAMFDRFLVKEVVLGDSKFWGFVTYPLAKHEAGHFIDANVMGLEYVTITESGTTGVDGQFWYLPGERVTFSLGSLYLGDALGNRSVTPADLFDEADMDDDRALNVARLLQSLDSDGNPAQGSINISETVVGCLENALPAFAPIPAPDVFFADDSKVGALIDATVAACNGIVNLTAIGKAEALENMNFGMQAGNIMKRNISKTPGLKSDKAKIEIMPYYVPAQTSDGDATLVVYHDADGNVIEQRDVAKPVIVAYVDEIEGTAAFDVFVAISRDDGDTWKRRNLSKTAGISSFALETGEEFPGDSEKPMLQVKDNMIFVAWTDKYCRGGRPAYAISVCPDVDLDEDGVKDTCQVCRQTANGEICRPDYPATTLIGRTTSSVLAARNARSSMKMNLGWARSRIAVSGRPGRWLSPTEISSGSNPSA